MKVVLLASIMAEAARKSKILKVLSEETELLKRKNRIKAQTRINTVPTFSRWRELKDDENVCKLVSASVADTVEDTALKQLNSSYFQHII